MLSKRRTAHEARLGQLLLGVGAVRAAARRGTDSRRSSTHPPLVRAVVRLALSATGGRTARDLVRARRPEPEHDVATRPGLPAPSAQGPPFRHVEHQSLRQLARRPERRCGRLLPQKVKGPPISPTSRSRYTSIQLPIRPTRSHCVSCPPAWLVPHPFSSLRIAPRFGDVLLNRSPDSGRHQSRRSSIAATLRRSTAAARPPNHHDGVRRRPAGVPWHGLPGLSADHPLRILSAAATTLFRGPNPWWASMSAMLPYSASTSAASALRSWY